MQKITWGVNRHENCGAYGSLEFDFQNKNHSKVVIGIMGWLARMVHKTVLNIQMLLRYDQLIPKKKTMTKMLGFVEQI